MDAAGTRVPEIVSGIRFLDREVVSLFRDVLQNGDELLRGALAFCAPGD